MGFIEVLNKHAYKIAYNHSNIYKQIAASKELFDQFHVNVKIKNEFDLVDYVILYRSLCNMKSIQDAYDAFVFHNYDMISYLKYDEKVRMFNADLKNVLVSLPKFYDQKNDYEIYLPVYEFLLNQRIIENYEMMQLKQHKEYFNSLKIDAKTAFSIYGEELYLSEFSPLIKVYEDERHICVYFDEIKKIYIIKKDTKTILNEIMISDHYIDYSLSIDDVVTIIQFIENYQYNECLEFLYKNQFINDKTYTKIKKKYK